MAAIIEGVAVAASLPVLHLQMKTVDTVVRDALG